MNDRASHTSSLDTSGHAGLWLACIYPYCTAHGAASLWFGCQPYTSYDFLLQQKKVKILKARCDELKARCYEHSFIAIDRIRLEPPPSKPHLPHAGHNHHACSGFGTLREAGSDQPHTPGLYHPSRERGGQDTTTTDAKRANWREAKKFGFSA